MQIQLGIPFKKMVLWWNRETNNSDIILQIISMKRWISYTKNVSFLIVFVLWSFILWFHSHFSQPTGKNNDIVLNLAINPTYVYLMQNDLTILIFLQSSHSRYNCHSLIHIWTLSTGEPKWVRNLGVPHDYGKNINKLFSTNKCSVRKVIRVDWIWIALINGTLLRLSKKQQIQTFFSNSNSIFNRHRIVVSFAVRSRITHVKRHV